MSNNDLQVPSGVRRLTHAVLTGEALHREYDDERDIVPFLKEAAYLTKDDIRYISDDLEGGTSRRNKTRIRYLAALITPTKTQYQVANDIHYVLDTRHLTIGDIQDILDGDKRDVPIQKIQAVGELLRSGFSLRRTAKDLGISYDTVERIENFIGIAESRRAKVLEFACTAVSEGWSVREFGKYAGIPKSTAHVLMKKARVILQELSVTPVEVIDNE
jgi:hypothetical protein